LLLLCGFSRAGAQGCPAPNIGFELATFQNWEVLLGALILSTARYYTPVMMLRAIRFIKTREKTTLILMVISRSIVPMEAALLLNSVTQLVVRRRKD
jgi:hypothetical protein